MGVLQADGTEVNGGGSRFRVTWREAVTWLIAGLIAYGTVNARVAVLESRVDGLRSDVSEIRQDVKTLLRR